MSATASTFYKDLVAQGVDESRARELAEKLDERAAELLRLAREHTNQAVADHRERSDAKYVGREEYHARNLELATRADLTTGLAEVRKDFRFWMAIQFAFLAPILAAAVKTIFFN